MKIVLATSNKDKVREIKEILGEADSTSSFIHFVRSSHNFA